MIDEPARAEFAIRGPGGRLVAGARIRIQAIVRESGEPVPGALAERIEARTVTNADGRAVPTAFFPESPTPGSTPPPAWRAGTAVSSSSLAGRVVDTTGHRDTGAKVHIRVQEHDTGWVAGMARTLPDVVLRPRAGPPSWARSFTFT